MNNSGITNFNVLNTNALYIQGLKVNFTETNQYLQGEIDAIEQQLVGISAITTRIDFNQPTPLVGNLVITEENKNSVLLTAIQNINTQIGSLNKLDLTALPAVPAGACVITPTTTNQALKTLIDNIDVSGLNKFDLTAIPAVPAGAIVITPTTTNQALKTLIDTNATNITTIQGQITTINNSITAINLKLAHFSTFSYGADTMSGIADGTGFACAVSSGSAAGNGIFVYPNASAVNEQIQIVTALDKNLLLRGGNQVGIFGGTDSSLVNRNLIDIGDKLDRINIGRNHNTLEYPEINIGVDLGAGGSASTTNIQGDIYYSGYSFYVPGTTPCLVAETTNPAKLGNTNNYSSDLTLTGLDVIAPVGAAPITFNVGVGNILTTCLAGTITQTALAGGIFLNTAAGVMALSCGAGGFSLSTGAGALSMNTGAGLMNLATSSANIEMSTLSGNISLGAGKAAGGTAGNTTLNAFQKVILQPDSTTEIYKTDFIEFTEHTPPDPTTTANRLYQQSNVLYFDGQPLGGGGGGGVSSVVAGTNISVNSSTASAPVVSLASVLTSTLNMGQTSITDSAGSIGTANQVLTCSSSGGKTLWSNDSSPNYVLKAGDTMTGALNLPEAITPIVTLTSLASAPVPTTNRLYNVGNVLYFNGVAVGGGGGAFLPLAGGTMTGQLISSYDAGQVTPQLQLTNTNNSGLVGGQGAAINLRNDAAGAGSVGERCGKIDFAGKDSAGAGGRTYAAIQGYINDPTSTAIDGRLSQFIASNNALTEVTRLVSTSTGVRQMNINAQNTTIGTSALGSASTETLRVQGSTAITTTLDVPLIQNAPAIYPATSTTQVDGAVRQYRPERLYKIDNYPANGLTAPTMDGEKIFILNKAGTPSGGLDQIWSAADFPSYGASTFSQVIQSKHVDSTSLTPACNFISTLYSDNICRVFMLPDIASTPLTMALICSVDNGANPVGILDMVIMLHPVQPSIVQRLYFGGGFTNLTLTGFPAIPVNNFSGQIIISWNTLTQYILSTGDQMTSHSTTQDTGSWGSIVGVNDIVTTIISQQGNSGSFPQPNVLNDSIVIGGYFTGINNAGNRPLSRMAWYDYSNAGGQDVTWINEPLVGVGQHAWNISYVICDAINLPTTDNYQFQVTKVFLGSPNTGGTPATWELWNNNNTNPVMIHSIPFTIPEFTQPPMDYLTEMSVTFPSLNLAASVGLLNYYYFQITATDVSPSSFGLGNVPDNHTNTIVVKSIAPNTGPIGWRTFANADWATPVGPTTPIRGGALFSNGSMGFAFDGNTITTGVSSTLTSNYYFNLQYGGGIGTFTELAGDAAALNTGQAILAAPNMISGGNPVYPFGALLAVGYGEIYLNRFLADGLNVGGISFRYTNADPYATAMGLIITTSGIASAQLFGVAGEACFSTWRDDTKFPNQYFISRSTGTPTMTTQTATLPWSQGAAPTYTPITLAGGGALDSRGFGGYSDDTGYKGLVIFTQPNGYLYKAGDAGELVIELTNCVVRTSGDSGNPVIASNKLTFPTGEDGTSIMLLGDTQVVDGKTSWWAVSQDGIVVFDNTSINSRGDGSGSINSITTSGVGISAVTTNSACVITNTSVAGVQSGTAIDVVLASPQVYTINNIGVTSIVAGTNVSISATGAGGTGAVTINAGSATTGYIKLQALSVSLNNYSDNVAHSINSIPNLSAASTFSGGIAVGNWDLGGTGSQLRWTGANNIMITMTLTMDVNTYLVSTGAYTNLIAYNSGQYAYSNFGYEIGVYNGSGAVTYSPIVAPWFCGASNVSYDANNALGGGQYQATTTYTGFLKQNDWIYVQQRTNPVFNKTGTAGQFQAFFLNSDWTLTIHECPANF
jgi:hypothetical protein